MKKKFKDNEIEAIITILEGIYPAADCTLDYKNPLELLIATILAAQCTDKRVNIVTEKLFLKYKDIKDYQKADIKTLEEDIRPTGFFKNKSKNIKACIEKLIKDYGGEVPDSMEELIKLPGVGRKTANVILSNVYGVPGITVDTHVKRLSGRIGLSYSKDPEKIEEDLMGIIPKEKWSLFSHLVVFHGREVCKARRPKCEICKINMWCGFYTSLR
ncbi:MAG: endonuclease III [Thermodesulfobacteriota bacterium]|nr:endonuclease III [Thermodesulfobacteriota bacterium]